MVLIIETPEEPEEPEEPEPEEPEPEEPEPEQPQPKELPMGTHTISIPDSDPLYYSISADALQAFNLTLKSAANVKLSVLKGDTVLGGLSQNAMEGFAVDGTALIKIENHSGKANSFTLKAERAPAWERMCRMLPNRFTADISALCLHGTPRMCWMWEAGNQ